MPFQNVLFLYFLFFLFLYSSVIFLILIISLIKGVNLLTLQYIMIYKQYLFSLFVSKMQ